MPTLNAELSTLNAEVLYFRVERSTSAHTSTVDRSTFRVQSFSHHSTIPTFQRSYKQARSAMTD